MYLDPQPCTMTTLFFKEKNEEANEDVREAYIQSIQNWKLSMPLLILFGLNGASIAFPVVAIMSIINDRVEIPVKYLSAYGAITFLPWSLKPLYAVLASATQKYKVLRIERHYLLFLLLFGSGISIGATAYIQKGDIITCFVLGFIRAILSAFPEFLVGLALVDEARFASFLCAMDINKNDSNVKNDQDDEYINNIEMTQHDYTKDMPNNNIECIEHTETKEINKKEIFNKISGMFQAQAATARNIGSLVSAIILFLIFFLRLEKHAKDNSTTRDEKLTTREVTIIIMIAASLPIIGAFLAIWGKVGSEYMLIQKWNNKGYGTVNVSDEEDLESTWTSNKIDTISTSESNIQRPSLSGNGQTESKTLSYIDIGVVISLQLLIILFGFKQIILQQNRTIWDVSVSLLSISLASLIGFAIYNAYRKTNASKEFIQRGPAFFLILKHAMPNISYQWSSYTYFLFQSRPIYLQILTLAVYTMNTCGSKVYEEYIAPRFSNLPKVFVVTTLLSTAISFLYLIPAQFWNTQDVTDPQIYSFLIVLLIGVISGFFGEITFLPSVVLATNSVQVLDSNDLEEVEVERNENNVESHIDGHGQNEQYRKEKHNDSLAMEYGTYLACIDFGDQLGQWLTVPIVSFLSINRSDWSRMGELICLCAVLNIVPLLFLWTLPGGRKAFLV